MENYPELSAAVDSLAETNFELAKVIRAVVSDFSHCSKPGTCKRFSIDALPQELRNTLQAFDFDGDGKVTIQEVNRGIEKLNKTKKSLKVAVWTLVLQFIVYAILTAISNGVLYHYLSLMNDTAVDSSTGSLIVKSTDSTSKVPVTTEAHGHAFTIDTTAIDSVTGEVKNCITGTKAQEMFILVSSGTAVNFLEQSPSTGVLTVNQLGQDSTWDNYGIRFEHMDLEPDLDCTMVLNNYGEESGEGKMRNRLLSYEDLDNAFIDMRSDFISRKWQSEPTFGRILKDSLPVPFSTTIVQHPGGNIHDKPDKSRKRSRRRHSRSSRSSKRKLETRPRILKAPTFARILQDEDGARVDALIPVPAPRRPARRSRRPQVLRAI